MIIRNSRINSNRASNLLNRINNFSVVKKKFEDFLCVFIQSTLFWTKACKLLLKVCYLLFKVRVLRFQRRNLLRKQRDLLFQKVNYVLSQRGGSGNSSNFLSGIERTHNEGKF